MPFANNKGADQPAHRRSLISACVVRFLDSTIPVLAKSEISRLYLVSVAEQAGLSLTWSETPKTGFLVTWLISYHHYLVEGKIKYYVCRKVCSEMSENWIISKQTC